MALEPRQLQAFLAVVECGSLGRAAGKLRLTQPALSRVVKRMESQLQVQLFERRANGMELTSFGEALLPYANHLTHEANLALEEINTRLGLGRGTVRIGTVASTAITMLPAVLSQLLTRWPNLHIEIVEAVEDRLAQALAHNDVDVVLSGPIPENEDIMKVGSHAYVDRSLPIAASGHPLLKQGRIALADALNASWVMPHADAAPRQRFTELVHRLGLNPPHVAVETRSPSAIKSMVAQTRLLGWLPEPLVVAERAAGLITTLEIEELTLVRHFFIYRRRRNFLPPPLLGLLDTLRRQ